MSPALTRLTTTITLTSHYSLRCLHQTLTTTKISNMTVTRLLLVKTFKTSQTGQSIPLKEISHNSFNSPLLTSQHPFIRLSQRIQHFSRIFMGNHSNSSNSQLEAWLVKKGMLVMSLCLTRFSELTPPLIRAQLIRQTSALDHQAYQ